MIRLRKYLRPFAGWIAAAMLLLLGQSFCELYLPNFLSDIVDVGIQRGGIEQAAPEAVSAQGLEMMALMMDEEDQALVKACYRRFDSESLSGQQRKDAQKNYPLLSETSAYLLQADASEREALDRA
ncbi:MAG: ABC transporter ATP-binding protein, partial [Clostridiales bacterium]|nr:ABC transporter ATP-binding protein [Clostridiales bacterium]